MDTPTIVNIVLSILSFCITVISIAFVVLTLKQNAKMIESSTRPYVVIYLDSVTICEQQSYFIIKNFGQSSAEIIDFIYPASLEETPQETHLMQEQFSRVKGLLLAPGQTCMLPYKVTNLPNSMLEFKIKYKSPTKPYCETFSLNPHNYIHIPKFRPNNGINNADKPLLSTLREMIERMF